MKITTSQLRRIIKEETLRVIKESDKEGPRELAKDDEFYAHRMPQYINTIIQRAEESRREATPEEITKINNLIEKLVAARTALEEILK